MGKRIQQADGARLLSLTTPSGRRAVTSTLLPSECLTPGSPTAGLPFAFGLTQADKLETLPLVVYGRSMGASLAVHVAATNSVRVRRRAAGRYPCTAQWNHLRALLVLCVESITSQKDYVYS